MDPLKEYELNETKVLEVLRDGNFADGHCEKLAAFLGIGIDMLVTFKADSASCSSSILIAAISYWLNNDDKKSWKKLAEALERSSYKLLAEEIRKRITLGEQNTMIVNNGSGASNQTGNNPKEIVSMPDTQDKYQDPNIRISESENSAGAVQSSRTDCSVNASRRFPEKNISSNLRKVVRNLDAEFADITRILLVHLNNTKISVEDIKCHISLPAGYINDCISPLWEDINKKIDVNHTLKDLFKALHMKLWNFLDYDLLESLIKAYGSIYLKIRMQNYVAEMEDFKQNTLLIQFFKCWRRYNGDIPAYINMDVKFEREDLTLADVDQFRKGLKCDHLPFLIEYASWIFHRDFEMGCIQVSWFIPELLSPSLRKNIDVLRTLFKEYGVCLVKLKEDTIYSVDYEPGELISVPDKDLEMQATKYFKITICGLTGSGKSTLANGILGQEVFESKSSYDAVTLEIQSSYLDWTDATTICKLEVFDTPGFFDGSSKEEHFESIVRECKDSDLLLYCINSSLNSIPKDIEAITKLKGNLGELAMSKIVIVLTFADKIVKEKKTFDDEQIKLAYNSATQTLVNRISHALQNVFKGNDVSIIFSSRFPNVYIIRGDKLNHPWLAQLLYEILEHINGTSLFPSLVRSHPYIKKGSIITVKDIAQYDRFLINAQSSNTWGSRSAVLSVAGGTAGGFVTGAVGASVGATIGALAIGVPTFGVAAGAGLVIGGAIGGAIGVGMGTSVAAAVSQIKKKKDKTDEL